MQPRTWIFLLLLMVPDAGAQTSGLAFEGFPVKKIQISYEGTQADTLSSDESFEYRVRIAKRSGKYYWASRGMVQLVRSESGAYITYHAINGSGYVRVYSAGMYKLIDQLPENERKREIGYVEHLVIQFGSVTYYGNRHS